MKAYIEFSTSLIKSISPSMDPWNKSSKRGAIKPTNHKLYLVSESDIDFDNRPEIT